MPQIPMWMPTSPLHSLTTSKTNFYYDNFATVLWNWTILIFDMLFCRITLMDSYSTDYYDISYPGLIMKVTLMLFGHWHWWSLIMYSTSSCYHQHPLSISLRWLQSYLQQQLTWQLSYHHMHCMMLCWKSLSLSIKSFAATPDPPADVPCSADLHPLHCLWHHCLALPLCSGRVCARTGRFVENLKPWF